MKWPLSHIPLGLEKIRTGAQLAPAKIESPQAAFARDAHNLPIHEIVGAKLATFVERTAIVGVDGISETKTQNRAHGLLLLPNDHHLSGIPKLSQQPLEETL